MAFFEDNRLYRRACCRIRARFENMDMQNRKPFNADISDISEGGLRFNTRWHSPFFEVKYVKFKVPGRDVSTVRIRRIWTRWVFSKLRFETGVRFLDLSLEDRWIIKELVRQQP